MDAKLTLQDAEKLQAALAVECAQPYIVDPIRRMYADMAAGQEPEKSESRFVLHSAIEAYSDFEEPEPLLDNRLWYPGNFSVLAGDGGTGKSYFLLNQCNRIANSGQNALYIDEENGGYLLKRRFRALAKGLGIEIPANLFYTCHAGIDLREPAHIEIIREWIIQNSIAFVVLDSLNAVLPGADENSSKDMKPPLMAIHRIADELQVCIAAVHHTNKNGGYRGSTAIKGEVDAMYLLTADNGGKNLTVRSEKVRDGAPFTLKYAVDFYSNEDGNLESVTYSEDENSKGFLPTFSKAERYVLRYLAENSNAPVTDITSHADACTEGAARRAVYSLADKGRIRRLNDGKQRTAAVYGLTESGKEAVNDM